MVCVKLLIVDVDGVLANNGEVLREIKKKYPNIAQLFHFRKSHHVHFVGPATTQIDIVNASNDVYHAAGEPFALTAEHATIFVSLVMTHTSDAIEKLLEGIFRETEKFARDDKLRPGWRVSGPMYGVCASTPERRRELMELCIAKINMAYDVKLVLMAEPFRVHIGVPMFS
ncbi:GPI-anchored surface protein, putative, partial [Bodo saltans]